MLTGGSGVREVQEGAGGLETDDDNTLSDQEIDRSGGDSEVNSGETVQQTVERVFREAAEKEESEQGEEGQTEGAEAGVSDEKESLESVAEKPARAQKKDGREWDADLHPPTRYSAEQKEEFNKLPKGQRRLINQMVRDHEGEFTRAMQRVSAREQEISDIDAVTKPFVAKWAEAGYSRSQAIAELIGHHEHMTLDKPKETRIKKLAWLCENCQVTPEELYTFTRGKAAPNGGAQVGDIESHPVVQQLRAEISSMREEIAPVSSQYRQSIAAQQQQDVTSAQSEFRAVQDERDASGRYRYPDLHDLQFIARVKPVVSGLIGTIPNITWGEALKRAYIAAGGKIVGNSPQPQTAFPAPNQSNSNTRALSAAGSLRGRSGPSTAISEELTPPPEVLRSPQATAEWVFANSGRGR